MAPVTFANALPWWALLLVSVIIAGVSWLAYATFAVAARRRNALIALRFITLALLVLFLLRPIRRSDDGMHDVVVPILVDASRSMSIEDADGQRRIDRARDLVVHTLVPVLAPHFQVEVLAFGDAVKVTPPGDLAATGRRSDLAGAIAAVADRYRGRPGRCQAPECADRSRPSTRAAPLDASEQPGRRAVLFAACRPAVV